MKLGLCIPTYNAEKELELTLGSLNPALSLFYRRIAIDSSSKDATLSLLHSANFETMVIPSAEFDHGGTRQLGVEILHDCDIIVFMTQDAILTSPQSIERLIKPFDDPAIGAAYGRQLPRKNAHPLEAHARLFNYPSESIIKSWPETRSLGIMAGALSNSFAAYRRSALEEIGGFPNDVVCSEDVYVGFRMLINSWKLSYISDSTVFHSHDYTPIQEFHRYFDIGAFYGHYERWITDAVGPAEGRGLQFIISELKYSIRNSPRSILTIPISAACKYLGFTMGAHHRKLPSWTWGKLGMNKAFWRRQ